MVEFKIRQIKFINWMGTDLVQPKEINFLNVLGNDIKIPTVILKEIILTSF